MKKQRIFEIAKKSSMQLWNNPILLVPTALAILFVGLAAVLGFVVLIATGFTISQNAVDVLSAITLPSSMMILLATVILLVIAVPTVLAFVYLHAGFFGMIKEISSGKKTSFKAINHYGQKFWARYIGVNVLVGLIFLGALILFSILNILFNYLLSGFPVVLPIIDAVLITLILLFIALFTLSQNYLILEDLKVVESLKRGYAVAKRNYIELIELLLIFMLLSTLLGLVPGIGFILSFLAGIIESIAVMNFAIDRR